MGTFHIKLSYLIESEYQPQRSRDELRTRKMQAMGIVTEGEGDPAAMVKEMTGVEMPSYYAPNAINPLKYAEGVRIFPVMKFAT